MKIVFVGAGNVATQMATQLYKSGCCIAQIYSKTIESAQLLAQKVAANATNDLNSILENADYYIFSVKDSVLEEVIEKTPHNDGMWIHTAGSMPLDVFSKKTDNFGVIYPLQTFSKKVEIEWHEIPLFIEYSSNDAKLKIKQLTDKLSLNIYPLSTEQRRYVHTSGVFACNFVNQMYELANQMIEKANLSFDVLLPLIEETCRKVHTLAPLDAQTGPAIRFDQNVMNKHLQLIEDEDTKLLYQLISRSIYKSHKK